MFSGNLPTKKYMLKSGYLVVNKTRFLVYGVLGSGLFLALWDQKHCYSGCCSFQYPTTLLSHKYTTNYGNVAIRHLIKKMQSEGSNIDDLKAHILGCGEKKNNKFGDKNLQIAKKILKKKSIEILSCDTGGKMGRKFVYDTFAGQYITMKVHEIRESDWYPYNKLPRKN